MASNTSSGWQGRAPCLLHTHKYRCIVEAYANDVRKEGSHMFGCNSLLECFRSMQRQQLCSCPQRQNGAPPGAPSSAQPIDSSSSQLPHCSKGSNAKAVKILKVYNPTILLHRHGTAASLGLDQHARQEALPPAASQEQRQRLRAAQREERRRTAFLEAAQRCHERLSVAAAAGGHAQALEARIGSLGTMAERLWDAAQAQAAAMRLRRKLAAQQHRVRVQLRYDAAGVPPPWCRTGYWRRLPKLNDSDVLEEEPTRQRHRRCRRPKQQQQQGHTKGLAVEQGDRCNANVSTSAQQPRAKPPRGSHRRDRGGFAHRVAAATCPFTTSKLQ